MEAEILALASAADGLAVTATWTLAETDAGMPYGTGPTQAAALDDAMENAYVQTETARDAHPSRDLLLSELRAGRLAWSIQSAD